MRWRRLMWLLVSVLVVAVVSRWGLGTSTQSGRLQGPIARVFVRSALLPASTNDVALLRTAFPGRNRFAFRLSNTTKSLAELLRSDRAILLENALVETAVPVDLAIPTEFRLKGEPGSYIVQRRGVLNEAYRASLEQGGAKVVAYIPNNAYLVRASESAARNFLRDPQTQAVLPYEPYYKVKLSLLEATSSLSPSALVALDVLLFPNSTDLTLVLLQNYGAAILSAEPSPFGRVVKIQTTRANLSALASMPEVQALEFSRRRVTANDLSRARIGVAADSITRLNYLGLTGTNIIDRKSVV